MKSIKKVNKLNIPVSFEKKPEEEIPLQAFLFNRNGELVEKKDVTKNSAEFSLDNLKEHDIRVFIAPKGDKRLDDVQTMAELKKFNPYEPVLNKNAQGGIEVLPIPASISRMWNLRICRIRGKVSKSFTIGNIHADRGICHARVHICEVDRIRWWINKIPDYIIKAIPDLVLNPKWPIPIPDPGPLDIAALNPQPLPPGPPDKRVPAAKSVFHSAVSETGQDLAAERSAGINSVSDLRAKSDALNYAGGHNKQFPVLQLTSKIQNEFLSGNLATIRKTLLDNYQLFHPLFCFLPWTWPYFYYCDEIKVVYTDTNGQFDTNYWYWWDGDQPDLYLWVEYLIDGLWTTVYKPPIPCNTFWDYQCGSEVAIHVTDPRVRWECNNVVEGDIVWVKTIGDAASVVHLPQTDMLTIVQGKSFNRIGLSDVSVWASSNAIGDYRRPFGSTLGFKVQFGSGIPSNGMYYYRWSYRKIRNADLFPLAPVTPVSVHGGQPLYKSYTYEFFDIFMHKHIGSKSFQLGPVSKKGNDDLYIIPPAFPASSPVNATESSPFWNQDTMSVWFDSTKFSDGLYEFFMELFDFAGNKLTAIPSALFQVPDYNTFAPSKDAPPSYLQPAGAGKSSAFKMIARIDNQKAEADIYKIKVNGAEVTTDCCGFVPYPAGANIEVAFRAFHPENFAVFGFTVQKGTCDDPAQSALTNASGMVIGNAGSYVRDSSSIFRQIFTPAQLLGKCGTGGKAAFAESLNVQVLTTDGSNQLYFLDDSALAAFALDPV